MKIKKAAATSLFIALGLKNADKWNDTRMAAKLGKIKEMVDEDVELEGDEQELLKQVMAAAEAGEEFEIEAEAGEPAAEAAEPKAEKVAKAPKKTDEQKAAEKAAKDAEKAAAKEARAAERAAAKAAKPKKEPKPTKAFLAGQTAAKVGGLEKFKRDDIVKMYGEGYSKAIVDITYYRTVGGLRGFLEVPETRPGRLYLAGKLLKENGLEVTKGLVAKLNEAHGKPNDKESQTALNHTKDVVLGFQSAEVAETEATEDAA